MPRTQKTGVVRRAAAATTAIASTPVPVVAEKVAVPSEKVARRVAARKSARSILAPEVEPATVVTEPRRSHAPMSSAKKVVVATPQSSMRSKARQVHPSGQNLLPAFAPEGITAIGGRHTTRKFDILSLHSFQSRKIGLGNGTRLVDQASRPQSVPPPPPPPPLQKTSQSNIRSLRVLSEKLPTARQPKSVPQQQAPPPAAPPKLRKSVATLGLEHKSKNVQDMWTRAKRFTPPARVGSSNGKRAPAVTHDTLDDLVLSDDDYTGGDNCLVLSSPSSCGSPSSLCGGADEGLTLTPVSAGSPLQAVDEDVQGGKGCFLANCETLNLDDDGPIVLAPTTVQEFI